MELNVAAMSGVGGFSADFTDDKPPAENSVQGCAFRSKLSTSQ